MPMTEKDLLLKLDRARWFALREQPFYGSLAMGLRDIIDQAVPTACTDGRSISWNPGFLAGLTDAETRFVLLHETLHCAHGHLWRLPPDSQANQACDYAINATLAALPRVAMPKDGLLDSRFDGMAEEEIYAALCAAKSRRQDHDHDDHDHDDHDDDDDEGQDNPSNDPGGCGGFCAPAPDDQPADGDADPENGSAGTGAPAPNLKDQWERAVIQAAQAAQALGQGSLPADMQGVLDRVRHQPIDWRQEMADFVRDAASTRNDWSRSARRHAWQSVIYPRRRADDLGTIIFARDTSGSIDARLCAEFSALISAALADTGCRGVVLDCDCEIQAEYELAPGDECPLTFQGGGGTSHLPVWARAQELADAGERIAGIVCLTDMYTDFPPDDGGFATLWLATSNIEGPFGRTVRIES